MTQVNKTAHAQRAEDKLVDIEITENGRQAVKKGPLNDEHEETDIM